MAAVVGILFTDLVGLPKFWTVLDLDYALDKQTLAIITAVVFAFVEAKRYDSYRKTGTVSAPLLKLLPAEAAVGAAPLPLAQMARNSWRPPAHPPPSPLLPGRRHGHLAL
jgi:hypothetical protein